MATTQLAKFTLDSAQKIADFIHKGEQSPADRTGSIGLRRSYNERGFWARIDCYCPLDDNAGAWSYAWVEQIRVANDQWDNRENGRFGTCCGGSSNYAINSIEYPNQSATNADGLYIQPVSSGVVVWMRMDFVGDSQPYTPVYSFAYENWASVDVPPTQTCCTSGSTSSSSNQLFCVFAYASFYDCLTGIWSAPQASGVNCQSVPPTVGAWVVNNSSSTVAYWYIVGNPCPGNEQTSGCGPFPPAPETLPTQVPICGSSSSSGSSSSVPFVCVFGWVSFYNCSTLTWSAPTKNGVNCQTPPATLNTWVVGSPSSIIANYYTVGGACPGPEQTGPCTVWGSTPPLPTLTPICGSTGSASSGSGSCSGFYSGTLTVVTGWDADACEVTTSVMTFNCGRLVGVA